MGKRIIRTLSDFLPIVKDLGFWIVIEIVFDNRTLEFQEGKDDFKQIPKEFLNKPWTSGKRFFKLDTSNGKRGGKAEVWNVYRFCYD